MTTVRARLLLLLALVSAVLPASHSHAITLNAAPSPATIGQNVTVSISVTFPPTGSPNCAIQANVGDGSPLIEVGTCVSSPCNLSVNHAYTTAGTFMITVQSNGACSPPPLAPDPAAASLTVQSPAALAVTPVPSSFAVARGQSSSISTNYQFTGPDTMLVSPGGSFMVGADTIEVNPVPLSVNILSGRGRAPEVITVPVKVLERALERGANRFTYVRNFSAGAMNLTATLSFSVRTEATADFEIKRTELYFENRRVETTVERNHRGLKAYADIRFVGSGLLQGYWEVDGRVLSTVNRHLAFGASVTLQTPEIPPLPTFDTGFHTVRFAVTSPVTNIPLPSIRYFVLPKEIKGKPGAIRLLSPENGAEIDYSPVKFQWEKRSGTALFFVQFFEHTDSNPVFSAYTKDPAYTLPETVLKGIFSPDKKYYWKTTAFDSENNITAESEVRSFSFKNEVPLRKQK